MLARLERRLPLLTGGPRDLPARLQTMRDAIAWSYDLLAPAEQRLFRRLAVFVAGFDLEAAESIAAEGNPAEWDRAAPDASLLDGLVSLAAKSLVRPLEASSPTTAGGAAQPRFGMLETIREYGLERLIESDEEGEVRCAHADYFLKLALRAKDAWFGDEQGRWFGRIHTEHDNLRAALRWTISRDDAAATQRLAGALWIFWFVRGHFAEGRGWLDLALALDDRTPLDVRIDATFGAGQLARHQGDVHRARDLAERVLTEPEAACLPAARARALFLLGNTEGDRGDYLREQEVYQRALTLFRDEGDDDWAARTLGKLGAVAWLQGDVEGFEHYSAEKLRLHRVSGNAWGTADALSNLGEVARLRGDLTRALALRREALGLYVAVGNRLGILDTIRGIATVAAASHRPTSAARLFGAEDALRRTDAIVLAADLQDRHASCLATVRAAMGLAAFAAAWDAGATLSQEAAVAEALAFELPLMTSPGSADAAAVERGLTRRELEVLRLLVAGQVKPGDRRGAVHQPAHRPDPRHQHPRQARRRLPHRGRRPTPSATAWSDPRPPLLRPAYDPRSRPRLPDLRIRSPPPARCAPRQRERMMVSTVERAGGPRRANRRRTGMTPNATVSYMAAQAERHLVEAKAARAWIVDEAAKDRAPRSGLLRLPRRLVAMLAVFASMNAEEPPRHRRRYRSPPLSMVDPAR